MATQFIIKENYISNVFMYIVYVTGKHCGWRGALYRRRNCFRDNTDVQRRSHTYVGVPGISVLRCTRFPDSQTVCSFSRFESNVLQELLRYPRISGCKKTKKNWIIQHPLPIKICHFGGKSSHIHILDEHTKITFYYKFTHTNS